MQTSYENAAVKKAVALRESGKLDASLSLLHVLCDELPDSSTAWHQLGLGYVQAGKVDHAYKCLMRATGLAPNSVQIAAHGVAFGPP